MEIDKSDLTYIPPKDDCDTNKVRKENIMRFAPSAYGCECMANSPIKGPNHETWCNNYTQYRI